MRRGSVSPGNKKLLGNYDNTKRRQSSLKDASQLKGIQEMPQIRDGDVYYKTERIFPSLLDYPEDITWTVTKSIDSSSPTMQHPALSRRDKSATGDRRASVFPGTIREESLTPTMDDTPRYKLYCF